MANKPDWTTPDPAMSGYGIKRPSTKSTLCRESSHRRRPKLTVTACPRPRPQCLTQRTKCAPKCMPLLVRFVCGDEQRKQPCRAPSIVVASQADAVSLLACTRSARCRRAPAAWEAPRPARRACRTPSRRGRSSSASEFPEHGRSRRHPVSDRRLVCGQTRIASLLSLCYRIA